MPKKTQVLKPDTVVKNYWRNNEQFADLFNAVLFHGNPVIKPDELEDLDTDASSVLEHRKYAQSIQASRDNIKISKRSSAHGAEFVILGNESQEHIHYAMPMRIMGYDYGTYKKQYDDNAAKYKTSSGMDSDEYLSKMKKSDKLIPVVTIVVYYGEKPWDGATSLHGMLNINKDIAPFVNDYKLLLVEARQNNLPLHNTNNIDLFNLLEILLDVKQPFHQAKNRAIEYTKKHQVDKSVIMAAAGSTNLLIDYDTLNAKGDADMCTVFQKNWAEGKAEGKTEGKAEGIIETGIEFGLSEDDILTRLQNKLNITPQKAQEYLNMFKNPA